MPLVVYISGLLSTFFTKPLNLHLGRKVSCFKNFLSASSDLEGSGTSLNGLDGKAPPVKGTFSRLQVKIHERILRG